MFFQDGCIGEEIMKQHRLRIRPSFFFIILLIKSNWADKIVMDLQLVKDIMSVQQTINLFLKEPIKVCF